MLRVFFFWGAWLPAGEGIEWLAAGTMPNSLYRMPLVYLSLTCVFCYSCSFLFVVCVFCVFLCSHWSLVDVPLIFFCPADHVPDWQPRVLLGMVEARSVNVKKTTTTTVYCILYTAYCIPYTAYCILHTAYCILYTAYCIPYTAYCKLYTAYCILYTVYCILHTVYCILFSFLFL